MDNSIVQLLLEYGYVIMFVLMYLEGPIVTMAAAFLASMGYFSLPMVLIVAILGDITGDIVLYYVGKRFGYRFVRGPGKYIGLSVPMIQKMQGFFKHHGGKTIFVVKSTTGLCFVTFVAAGIAKMDFKKFLFFSLLGGVVWSATLVALGFFFGYLYEEIARYLSWAGWVVGAVAVGTFALITLYKKQKASNFLHDETK